MLVNGLSENSRLSLNILPIFLVFNSVYDGIKMAEEVLSLMLSDKENCLQEPLNSGSSKMG